MEQLDVMVAGLGNMGRSHALAYHNHPFFNVCCLINRSAVPMPKALQDYPLQHDFHEALAEYINNNNKAPDLVSINTYSDTHAEYAIAALNAGSHVFLEKPIATTVKDAEAVVNIAHKNNRKLVVGYILRHHPSWQKLISEARKMGGPYVFRLNLNQQSSGPTWATHKQLMKTTSPIVDCGVHYVDVMCQVTDAKPVRVTGMGLRLSDELPDDMYNYGHFQVVFSDQSVGWYEAGWGPMMSESAFFVKDIVSPKGSVSIMMDSDAKSDDIDTHTRTSTLKIHHAATDADGKFINDDIDLSMAEEPDHQILCNLEQEYVYKAITEDLDLSRHMQDAISSLAICLAADHSVRTGKSITL